VSNDRQSNQVEQQGFAILSPVVPSQMIEEILDEISQSASHRSRAGVRHAMHLAPVKEAASCPELMTLAGDVLGPQAFRFERRSSTNLQTRIGSWCGIRTRPCHCEIGGKRRDGGLGRRKKALLTHMRPLRCFRMSSH